MTRPVQHSFSALELFKTCPKKYWHTKIRKDVTDSRSSVGDYGVEAHKFFENRLLRGTPLPLDLQHHESNLQAISDLDGEGLPEQKLAINRDFQPTGFFDSDVYLRAVIDYVKVRPQSAVIVDHKFGKRKESWDQVELMAATLSCFRPELKAFSVGYYWAKEKKWVRKKLHRTEIPNIWEKFVARFNRVERAVADEEFPAKPNGLCKRYCPVKTCPHNGQ